MDDTLSSRKVTGPVLPPTVLHRPSLVAALNEAVEGEIELAGGRKAPRRKLVLVCAPAGYGKTTLLADFAAQTSRACCWCILDHVDNDKITFLEHLLASIRQRFPAFGASLDRWLTSTLTLDTEEPARPDLLETVAEVLASALAAEITERFALILCDYHEVNQNREINLLLDHFIRRQPASCVLLIESRAVPGLVFAPLLTRQEVLGIGSSDLHFSAQEIRDLARIQHITLREGEAEQLEQSFNGWIAGILLGTRLGDLHSRPIVGSSEAGWNAPAIKMNREILFAYLVKEVFRREPDAYQFLREAIVLRRMTPDLCSTLLGISNTAWQLAYLERQGLFVTHYDEGAQRYYVCHPALRDLLYEELRAQDPGRLVELHGRAAEIFRGVDSGEAIFHALAAGMYDVAAALIGQVCGQQFAQGRLILLAGWIDALPSDTLARYPQLLLVRANIFLATGEHTQAQPLLDRARAAIEPDADEAPVLQAQIFIARSSILFQQGDYHEAQALCQQALDLLPPDEVVLRAEAHQQLGTSAGLNGSFATCIRELQRALQLRGCDTQTRQVARLHSLLANAYEMVGNHVLSEHHRARAVHCWEHLGSEWGKINNLIGLGVARQRQGALKEAEQILKKALAASRGTIGYRRGEAYALISLGDVYQDQDDYLQALSAFEEGLMLARQQADAYLLNYALCALAITYLLLGDSQTALVIISQIDQARLADTHGYEYAQHELTLGTILLYQQHFGEALTHLTTAEKTLQASGSKREQLQAAIRLASCLLGLKDLSGALRQAKGAIAEARSSNYEQIIQIELHRSPDLLRAVYPGGEEADQDELGDEEADVAALPAGEAALLPHPDTVTVTAQRRSSLRILAFGEPSVYVNGQLITHWRMARSLELFFLLLNASHPLSKESIVTALWPETDEQTDQTFRSTLYYLRRALGKSCVTSIRGAFKLNLTAEYEDVWYDVSLFQRHYESARQALGKKDDTASSSAFQEMVTLYRGDYLQSFYSNWCIARREQLRQAYVDAHHQSALIAWRNQQLDRSIFHWQHLLTVDACLESAHYGLMRCYLRQSRRGLALRQYQRCVTSLHDELGATPGQAIQRLYERLIKDS
ncbi:MAG TPA: BTAD domain-containing putative transcriptional regulator [Ktedonobacteraceae bacterium]|nr:BTAD domain-containing putative transcriptional regulator [Ktedonobacteraceae bacterium]